MNNIKNIKTLKRIINRKIHEAVRLTSEDIHYFIFVSLQSFYKDYHPKRYRRTHKFLESLNISKIIVKNNTFHCTIGLNDSYLDYVYDGGATGENVATWADDPSYLHTHGGTVEGRVRVFDDAWTNIGGYNGIKSLLKKNLIQVGLPIK